MNDAGRIGFLIRGAYNNTETYDFLDVVYYGNSSYVAKKLTVGNPPADNNEYWQILADAPECAVLGVKGNSEIVYRTGNINITPENIGAVAKSGDTLTGELITDGGIKYVGKDNYIVYPDDGYLNTPNAATNNLGFLRVILPVSWTTTMLKFIVTIYDYLAGETTDYHISGYTYGTGNTWISCTAICVGKAGTHHSNLPVSFGHDGTNCAITIGNANTSWHYPIVKVHDILLGKNESDFSKWKTGWNISVNTTPLPTVNVTIENTHVAYGGISSSCTGNAASATKATQDGNGNVIKDTYLPLSGGTVTGNLRLKGSGNYGNKLNFGDGDYVHISEPEDDRLEIKATKINFVTGSSDKTRLTMNGSPIGKAEWTYKGTASYRGGTNSFDYSDYSEIKMFTHTINSSLLEDFSIPLSIFEDLPTGEEIKMDNENTDNIIIRKSNSQITISNNYYAKDIYIYAR